MSLEQRSLYQLWNIGCGTGTLGVVTKNSAKINAIAETDVALVTSTEVAVLEAMQDMMEKKLEQAYQLTSSIMDKLGADQAASEFELRIQIQIKEIERLYEKLDPPRVDQAVSSQMSASVPKSSGLEMPKFDLPKFSGKYKDSIPFFDQFKSAINMHDAIPDIQKIELPQGMPER